MVTVTGSHCGPEAVEEFATSQGQADRPILVLGVRSQTRATSKAAKKKWGRQWQWRAGRRKEGGNEKATSHTKGRSENSAAEECNCNVDRAYLTYMYIGEPEGRCLVNV